MWLPISLTMAGAAALLNVWLSIRVGQVRTREKVMVGDGGNEIVIRRMRAHSNFIENTPFVLILIALLEISCGGSVWLWGAGFVYLLGRVAHAFGMDGMGLARLVGTVVTLLSLAALAGAAIYTAYTKDAAVNVDAQPAQIVTR